MIGIYFSALVTCLTTFTTCHTCLAIPVILDITSNFDVALTGEHDRDQGPKSLLSTFHDQPCNCCQLQVRLRP